MQLVFMLKSPERWVSFTWDKLANSWLRLSTWSLKTVSVLDEVRS